MVVEVILGGVGVEVVAEVLTVVVIIMEVDEEGVARLVVKETSWYCSVGGGRVLE